ncbi:MAG: hypothetical protein AAGG44_16055, partial [Planctomycetota bacterium]
MVSFSQQTPQIFVGSLRRVRCCAIGLTALLCVVLASTGVSWAQEDPITRATDPLRETTSPLVLEMRLEDKDTGDVVVVPNLTVEELIELRDRARNSGSNYLLEKLVVNATVKSDYAEV